MTHTIRNENIVKFAKAATYFHDRPSCSTLHRWADKGVGGVVLESFWRGRRRYTSEEAIGRFDAANNQSAVQRAEAALVGDGC